MFLLAPCCTLPGFFAGFVLVTRGTECLEILEVMGAAVNQGNHVIEFPQRAARLEAPFAKPCSAPTAPDLASQRVGVEPTRPTDPPVAFPDPAASLAGITLVVLVHARGMPAATEIGLPLLRSGVVQNRLSAPAAGAARGIAEGNAGTPVLTHLPRGSPGSGDSSGGGSRRLVNRVRRVKAVLR